MQFGIIGSGSWATALAKILTDKGNSINWFVRSERIVNHLNTRQHNPNYLSSVYFDKNRFQLYTDIKEAIAKSDCIVVAVPSAYAMETLQKAGADAFKGKKVISAIKGILPENNLLAQRISRKRIQIFLLKIILR